MNEFKYISEFQLPEAQLDYELKKLESKGFLKNFSLEGIFEILLLLVLIGGVFVYFTNKQLQLEINSFIKSLLRFIK